MKPHAAVVKIYVKVFIALLVLLAITVGVAFIPSPDHGLLRSVLTAIAFFIAGTKAVLIILWFMHVKSSGRLIWIAAAAAFVWLVILFALTFNDYFTRISVPAS